MKIPLEFIGHELRKQGKDDAVAIYEIKKPSNLPPAHRRSELPKVLLVLKEKGNDFSLEVMHKVRHRGILRLEGVEEKEVKGQRWLAVFLEPHDGPLIDYLKEKVVDTSTRALPSQSLRDLVRQIVDCIEGLRANGLYHGDLSIHNIYYCKENHVVVIKFANFRRKNAETSLETAQLLDYVGLGHILTYISNAAKFSNADISCSVIDHLASKLQGLTNIALLPNLKREIFNGPFFWDPRKRIRFYIHDIPRNLNDATFLARVRNYMGWLLPWNINPHNGLIAAMDTYRQTKLKLKVYDGSDPVANIKCMSGAYTHQDDMEGKIFDSEGRRMTVDAAVQQNQPELTLTLYRLMKGEVDAEEQAAAAAAAPH